MNPRMNELLNEEQLQRLRSCMIREYRKPLPGLLSRILGERVEYSYDIRSVSRHAASCCFRRVSLRWVHVKESFLSHPEIPGGGSRGIFAFTDRECLSLDSSAPGRFHQMLLFEGCLPSESPYELCTLVADTILSTPGSHWYAVRSVRDLPAGLIGRIPGNSVPGMPSWPSDPRVVREGGRSSLSFHAVVEASGMIRSRTVTFSVSKDLSFQVHTVACAGDSAVRLLPQRV